MANESTKMTEAQIAFLVISGLVKYGPEAAKLIREILQTAKPTDDQYKRLWEITQEPFDSNVPVVPDK